MAAHQLTGRLGISSLHRLTIRCFNTPRGEIDAEELERFLDEQLGRHNWLMTSEWLFADPPVEARPGLRSVPVACPPTAARKLRDWEDCHSDAPRLLGECIATPRETRLWRWVAFQVWPRPNGLGLFPWEARVAV